MNTVFTTKIIDEHGRNLSIIITHISVCFCLAEGAETRVVMGVCLRRICLDISGGWEHLFSELGGYEGVHVCHVCVDAFVALEFLLTSVV